MSNEYIWTTLIKDIILVILCYFGMFILYTIINELLEAPRVLINYLLDAGTSYQS